MRYHVFRGNAREPHGGFGDYRGTRAELAPARELLLTGADSLDAGHIVSDDGATFSVVLVLTWRGPHAILEAPADRDLTALAIAEASEGNALHTERASTPATETRA